MFATAIAGEVVEEARDYAVEATGEDACGSFVTGSFAEIGVFDGNFKGERRCAAALLSTTGAGRICQGELYEGEKIKGGSGRVRGWRGRRIDG